MTTSSVEARIPDLPTAIAYLFTAYQKPLDDIGLLVSEHQLADIEFQLVQAAVLEAPRRLTVLPAVHEVRALCETLRKEWRDARPFTPCLVCRHHQPGWNEVVDASGSTRLRRCECWLAHQRVIGPPIRQLPGRTADEASDAQMTAVRDLAEAYSQSLFVRGVSPLPGASLSPSPDSTNNNPPGKVSRFSPRGTER
jgi:hypothetical protein